MVSVKDGKRHSRSLATMAMVNHVKAKKKAGESVWSVQPAWSGCRELAAHLRMPELIAQLLYNRGVSDVEQAQQFLHPKLNDLIDPQQLQGIPEAVKRIRRAIADKEKIFLYGDYDVDGIAGVSILWRCLKLAGVDADFYVPHRIEEGYGLNVDAIRQLSDKGADLIITVDCGITAHESAHLAAELGMDLIVTDHHQIEAAPVNALAVIHPGLAGQDYPNPNLCGAGVAFKLAWALAQEFSGARKVSEEFRQFLLSATGLAALGTIADVVDLVGENRILARFGMETLAHCDDTGIKALIKAAGLEGERLQSDDIGFRLAPRLNAAGRMGHARLAVELFTRSSPTRADEIANYLETQNRQRQKVEKEIAAEAIDQIKDLKMDSSDWRGLVVAHDNWHGGVIGIVASRLVDKYHRPAVVISINNDKAMGSCRSVPGFNICGALEACSEHLISFGGHAMAAGLNIEPDKIETFQQAFNQYALTQLQDTELVHKIEIDAEIDFKELDIPCVEMIERLGPFGAGNPQVRLVIRNLKLIGPPRRMGQKAAHLQFNVAPAGDSQPHMRPGGIMRVVAFGKAQWEKKLIDAEKFELLFQPVINRYNGNTTVEMMAIDIRFG
ncbi:MAG: single-stranded-DNA-specific exonuclease RecJ [Sedimentisphaerales bacterium]|nr:single-stranded-DNA-specific exonuclease RecJ [Sedimentisphaerales bacterium]